MPVSDIRSLLPFTGNYSDCMAAAEAAASAAAEAAGTAGNPEGASADIPAELPDTADKAVPGHMAVRAAE